MGYTVRKAGGGLKKLLSRGDVIARMDGREVGDIVDLAYFMSRDSVELTVRKKDGGAAAFEVRGEELQELSFEEELLGPPFECCNKCLFCFVHQLPRGMRRTLYVRDDDWRYSLLYGAYVTLSNISDGELSRIAALDACPLYISVHAADDGLRRRLLGNENARSIRELCGFFRDNGLTFHAQIVLTPGYNDGDALSETLEYLYSLHPCCLSVAVVPVGLTGHREKLPALSPVTAAEAGDAIDRIAAIASRALSEKGTRFAFASDEMYIKAGRALPGYEEYEDFPQAENGVGLIAALYEETENALAGCSGRVKYKEVSVATGEDAYPYICDIAKRIEARLPVKITVYRVHNRFFGGGVTVAGLLTGGDVAAQLEGRDMGDLLILPPSMLRDRTDVFLDGMSVGELSRKLKVKISAKGIETLPFVR